MTDDHAQSSPNEYLTLSEASVLSEISYDGLYKAVRRGRLKATMFEPDHVPTEVLNRLEGHAHANVTKKHGIWIIRRADLDEHLLTRRQGYRSDLMEHLD